MDDKRPEVLSDEEQFEIQRNKFNKMNWTGEYYDLDTNGQWQPGWCGGGISGYPLMKLGGDVEKERAIKTLSHLFDNQSPSGLFYGFNDKKGDSFGAEEQNHWLFIRKLADALYFAFKQFSLMENILQKFIDGAQKLSGRFVTIWEKYGQFGQFIDANTGDILVGNSTAGAIVPAALIEAYKFFGDEKYLTVAKESAEFMYNRDAKNGYTTGGPGEILQGPDSESAAALLESLVLIYECDKEEKWIQYACYEAGWGSSIAANNVKEFIGPEGRIRIVERENREWHEEGDLIEFYGKKSGRYYTINVGCVRRPTGAQLKHLIKMIEDDVPAVPSIDDVFESFQVAIKADRIIRK